jgi:two-component system chemotaxis response regulator CheB
MNLPHHTLPAPFELIAIGGSAGGVDAALHLLAHVSPGCAAAVAVMLHLPPAHETRLPQVFGARCALPAREAADKEPIAAGTLYVAPPDYHLLVEEDRCWALSVDAPVNYSRPSIDVLFESAAVVYGPRMLAIVLTGANADGAQGAAAVQRRGGTVWVQDPASAKADAMPRAALHAVGQAALRSLDAMGAALGRLPRLAGNPLKGST